MLTEEKIKFLFLKIRAFEMHQNKTTTGAVPVSTFLAGINTAINEVDKKFKARFDKKTDQIVFKYSTKNVATLQLFVYRSMVSGMVSIMNLTTDEIESEVVLLPD